MNILELTHDIISPCYPVDQDLISNILFSLQLFLLQPNSIQLLLSLVQFNFSLLGLLVWKQKWQYCKPSYELSLWVTEL